MEVDFASPPLETLLVTRKNKEGKVEEDFFIGLVYEKLPKFCRECGAIGYDISL